MSRFTTIAAASASIVLAMISPAACKCSTAATPTPQVPVRIPLFIIHAGTMLDGRGASVHNAYVVVRGTHIERVATTPVKKCRARK